MDQNSITTGTHGLAMWWLENRQTEKILSGRHDTFNPNPFLLPLVAALHDAHTVDALRDVITIGHLMGGNNTGFGKLIDEKLLPEVFNTTKLTKAFREATPPYSHSAFNDIDHLVLRKGRIALLSLKASRWTINLGGARDLNRSFAEINRAYIRPRNADYSEIAVGVLYGNELTDKYQMLRGETQRQRDLHDVVDLTSCVNVHSGRAFWAWLNDDEDRTQDWVLDGILAAAESFRSAWPKQRLHLKEMARKNSVLDALGESTGALDFDRLMRQVNG